MSKLWWVKKNQLDEAQLEIVDEAGKGRGFVLVGPPGSGKTNLLMLATAAMKDRGFDNTKVVVFTGALRDFITRGLETYKLEEDAVGTLTQVARTISREHGDPVPSGGSFLETQAAWRNNFLNYVAAETNTDRVFDALLMDESQDFNAAEVDVLFSCTGYAAFSIDTNQSIYERSDAEHPVFALQRANALPLYELTCHYRAGRRICRFADLVMEGKKGYSSIEENSMYKEEERQSLVNYENSNGDQQDEFEKIIGRVNNQLTVYPGERIGILFPKNDQIQIFKEYCAAKHPLFLNNEEIDDAGIRAEVMIGTMHEAKGLEFAVVHLAGQEKLSVFATQRTLLFTSVTRSRFACYITASGKVPQYLTSAYNRLDGPKPSDPNKLFPQL